MAAKVFISYRRGDSAGHTGRIHDRLEREFGRDLLFMDVDAIPLGLDFAKVLQEQVAKCDILLAVIGPEWLNAKDKRGDRRLDNPQDFVRVEIATALARDVPVVPVLLEGTRMPRLEDLPEDLKQLPSRNALDVRHASFHNDVGKLVAQLKGSAKRPVDKVPSSAPNSGERLAHLTLLISEFFQPVKTRLEKDKAIWRRIIRDKDKPDSLEYKLAATVEKDYVIPNHEEIVGIIEKWRHLVDDDAELSAALNAYLDHVVVFKSLRSAGEVWTYPELVGSPWPVDFGPLIDERLKTLLAERNALTGA